MAEAVITERRVTLAYIFNQALPGANTGVLANVTRVDGGNTALSAFGNQPAVLYIEGSLSIAGVLSIMRKRGATTKTSAVLGGSSLTAGAPFQFKVRVQPGDTIDFSLSTTGGNIDWFIVHESGME